MVMDFFLLAENGVNLACHLSELDLLIDRRSFLKFVGIHMDQEIPCLKTFWRFKEALVEEDLDQQIL